MKPTIVSLPASDLAALLEIVQRTSGTIYTNAPCVRAAIKALTGQTDVRGAMYQVGEFIANGLQWLDSLESASDRITGARACLRKAQEVAAPVNRETDTISAE